MVSTNSFMNGLFMYIDFCLQPLVTQLQSFIRDSDEVIDTLHHYTWEEGYLWAFLDVASLYTSIPHEVGLRAVHHFLSNNGKFNSFQSNCLIKSTEFSLKHIFSTFCEQFYVQWRCTVMGANFAPVYANLTMGHWEENIWANNPFAEYIGYYGRYIDDIVFIWSGGPDVLPSFLAHCNANMFGLSLTHVLDTQ